MTYHSAPSDAASGRPAASMNAAAAAAALRELANVEIARHSARSFKTGPGVYGEGDRFLGVRVPDVRGVARRFAALPLTATGRLLRSRDQEIRLLGLLILVRQFHKGTPEARAAIHAVYGSHLEHVDNWDLVDLSAPHIVGEFLRARSRRPLCRLARSRGLWHRRVAVPATFAFIRSDDFTDALAIARQLPDDPEDLLHKATGWMLREIGKRDVATLRALLREQASVMPRTILRYAIEKLPEPERRRWLASGPGSRSRSRQ